MRERETETKTETETERQRREASSLFPYTFTTTSVSGSLCFSLANSSTSLFTSSLSHTNPSHPDSCRVSLASSSPSSTSSSSSSVSASSSSELVAALQMGAQISLTHREHSHILILTCHSPHCHHHSQSWSPPSVASPSPCQLSSALSWQPLGQCERV